MAQASLFFEHDGKLVGPYSVDEIAQQLHAGSLRVSARLFDADNDRWTTAADVIPNLNFESPRDWRPPARPVDLSNVHVAKLNRERTEGIDYFALISERKKEIHREKSNAKPQTLPNAKTNWAAPKIFSQGAAEITKTLKRYFKRPSKTTGERAASTGKVLDFAQRSRHILRENLREFAVAASLALVFTGTYALVKTFSNEQTQRQPAATGATPKSKPVTSSKPFAAEQAEEIGKGSAPIQRPRGSAGAKKPTSVLNEIAPLAAPAPTEPPANAVNQNTDNQGSGPLYYSTSEDYPQEQVVTDDTQTTPGEAAYPGPNSAYSGTDPTSSDPAAMQAVTGNRSAYPDPPIPEGVPPPVGDDAYRTPTSDGTTDGTNGQSEDY